MCRMEDDVRPSQEVVAELEALLLNASHPVVRLRDAHGDLAAHLAHPCVAQLVQALYEVDEVLMRFDLASVADEGAGFALALRRRQAIEHFDSAFDEALGRVHAVRHEAARVTLAASARGSTLSPHVVQLRRELHTLHRFVTRSQALLEEMSLSLAGQTLGRGAYPAATALVRRAIGLQELHATGRQLIDHLRHCEEAFAALIVRLKHELAPTYVEWKRLLAPVAMRAFEPEPQPLELPEAREVHALLQRQVGTACETAQAFEAAQRQLEESVDALGRRARAALEPGAGS